MAKLDRLGWADGIAFRSHTARLGVRVSNLAVHDLVADRLPPGWKRAASSRVDILHSLIVGSNGEGSRLRRYNLLYVGSRLLARAMDLSTVLDAMESDLHWRVALFARNRLFVHAGVVGWHGRAIVIPGRTLSGKSSLVAALVRAGATYYSDEYAVFDSQGRVHPYAKPLTVRQPNGESPRRCPVDEIGGRAGNHPLPLGLVVHTTYHPEARWRPRSCTRGQAMMALFDNTVLARIRPQFALGILEAAVAGTTALRGPRGEAERVVGAIHEHIAVRPR